MATDKKTRLTKQDFNAQLQGILAATKANAQALSTARDAGLYDQQHKAIAEHDPELAKLLREADFAAIEPLNKIVKYLGSRVEN